MKDEKSQFVSRTAPIQSATFTNPINAEIRRAADTGIYDIRGGGAKRRVPHFDDLLFLGASISRYPLEGYREKCDTRVTLGTRFAKKPIELDMPVTIAGMSFGALSGPAKEALGRGASAMGTSTTTGDGGMTQEERGHSDLLVYQYLPSRYGMNPDDLRKADAIYLEEIRNAGLYDAIWQAFAVLLPVKTVGVMGDGRTYDSVCGLRAVTSTDGMTADIYPFDASFLSRVATRIINEVQGINRVVYDYTSKPPGTIEWE